MTPTEELVQQVIQRRGVSSLTDLANDESLSIHPDDLLQVIESLLRKVQISQVWYTRGDRTFMVVYPIGTKYGDVVREMEKRFHPRSGPSRLLPTG